LFDKFLGLPTHILVLHFTVVLVPLVALVTIAVFLRATWRKRWVGWVAILDVAMLALTFVTVRAGWDLESRYRVEGDTDTPGFNHETLGKALLWIMVALAPTAVLAWWVSRIPNLSPVVNLGLGGFVASIAVASIVLTALAGHTGAEASWTDFIKFSDKALAKKKMQQQSPPPTVAPAASPSKAPSKAPAAKPKS
jgi:hypothetical protein